MSKRIIPYFTLLLLVFTSTLLSWFPFLLKGEMSTIYKHFDGPLYIIAAKSAYDPAVIQMLDRDAVLPHNPLYFAAHLPLYPFFIRLASSIGYLKSMLAVTLLATIGLAWAFYTIIKKLNITKQPLILTVVFLFLPRFLVVRSVGSPEPLFILLILGSLFFFEKKQYLLAGLLGGLSVMTKTPGILLFPAYFFALVETHIVATKGTTWRRIFDVKYLPLLLVPVGLLAVFGIYALQYGDFLAYFHSGDNVHLLYPYSVFSSAASWVGTAWLEDVLFYFTLYAATVITLWNSKHRSFFYFALVFFSATLFVQHRDISRYSLPLWPLAAIAFEHILTSRKALIVGGVILIGIYMYAWNFLGANVMPISEWLPFL